MEFHSLERQLMDAIHSFHKNKPSMAISDSHQGETFILKYLTDCNGPARPSEISKVMGISTARTAAALNNLEKKGLTNREIDKSDRRQILVTLTPEGEKLAQRQQEEIENNLRFLLENLGEQDSKELIRILLRIVEIQSR